jgi:cyclopropane-fatty-acyl-phospholipid synthase
MDRLLQFLLKTFIRRGAFRVTTSRGTVFTFGDGTGQPVSARFISRRAEWGILLDPELKFGESYMPMTRDYILREEQRLFAAEGKRRAPLRLAGE